MAALDERRARLAESTRDQVEEPPLLHPGLAEVCRRKVEKLTEALNKEELQSEAAEMLRSMTQAIRLLPENGELTIELVGILALTDEKAPVLFGPGARQLTLVAGQGFEPAHCLSGRIGGSKPTPEPSLLAPSARSLRPLSGLLRPFIGDREEQQRVETCPNDWVLTIALAVEPRPARTHLKRGAIRHGRARTGIPCDPGVSRPDAA
jgi:hypothetical protein